MPGDVEVAVAREMWSEIPRKQQLSPRLYGVNSFFRLRQTRMEEGEEPADAAANPEEVSE